MSNSFLRFQSPIPVSRNVSFGEAVLQATLASEDEIDVIKLPKYLQLEDSAIQVNKVGNLLYASTTDQEQHNSELEQFLADGFQFHLSSVEYHLKYHWLVEMYHLMSLDHIRSTHWLTLKGFSIERLFDYSELDNRTELTYDVVLPNSLDVFKQDNQQSKKSIVTLILFSAFTVGMRLRINESWNFLILFNVLPTSENSHQLFVDFYSSKEVQCRFLTDKLIKLVSFVTVVEDLEYLKIISKRSLFRKGKNESAETKTKLKQNTLIERFHTLYSKHF
ncbi:MAG: hypothetical protein ACRCXZ_00840 [Patescibacteria group bacterium]